MKTQLATFSALQPALKSANRPYLRRKTASGSHLVSFAMQSAGRCRVEAFIAEEFREHFDARIDRFMPTLVGLYDTAGQVQAAAGYRPAADGPLFLEAYTNAPVEVLLREMHGVEVDRAKVVEVGSLACHSGRAAMEIVAAMVPALIEQGFSWVVFTGADTVRNVFRRLQLKPLALCIANKSVLGERQFEWGTYYDHNPVVMAGAIADGIRIVPAVGGVQ